jgi:pyrroline-5-carboxylate reductase
MENNIAIIGAGNLGISIATGLVDKGVRKPEEIFLTKRDISSLATQSKAGFGVTNDNLKAITSSKIILLCVQPKQLKNLMDEIKSSITSDHILVSVITGIALDQIKEMVEVQVPVVRAMPNTAIAVGESMTCLACNQTDEGHLPEVITLFDALGKTLKIEEDLMQAATVLGASGIAFFMRYLRAATQGGVQMGFDSKDAQQIAMQTAKGAAMLVQEDQSHPEVEIDKVTTPQGCTIEGLNEMEHKGFSSALIQGIMTSYYRITKMKSGKVGTRKIINTNSVEL